MFNSIIGTKYINNTICTDFIIQLIDIIVKQ